MEFGLAAKPEDALDYASLLVEQHGVGQAPVVIDRFHIAAADENREWWGGAKFGDKRAHFAAADVVRDGGDIEIRAAELAVELGHVREFLSTRCAPGCPEVHERNFAAIILEPDGFTAEVGEGERRGEELAPARGNLREETVGIEHADRTTALDGDGRRLRPEGAGRDNAAACRVQHVEAQARRRRVFGAERVDTSIRPDRHGDVHQGMRDPNLAPFRRQEMRIGLRPEQATLGAPHRRAVRVELQDLVSHQGSEVDRAVPAKCHGSSVRELGQVDHLGDVDHAQPVGRAAERVQEPEQRLAAVLADELDQVGRARGDDPPVSGGVQRGGKRALPLAHRFARGVEHDGFAGALCDQQPVTERRDGQRCGKSRIGDRADDVQVAIEAHEPAVVGVGGPREGTDAGRGGATQEEEGETAGGRVGTAGGQCQECDRNHRPACPQRASHQVAAAIVLISIVCMPWLIRWTPVTFTCPSANGASFVFCGSPGLELTGM